MKVEGFLLFLGVCVVAFMIFTGFLKVLQKSFSSPRPPPVISDYEQNDQDERMRDIQQRQKQLMRDQKQRIKDLQRH